MTLQTALSGLDGAQTGLNTVSNDLANASTTAYKNQTALFGDIYPADESNVPGIGVFTSEIDTNYSQGDLSATGNPLDTAIQGAGFFTVRNNGTQQYTRDGSFSLDSNGTLVTSTGATVLGFAAGSSSASGAPAPITINTGAVPANATANVGLTLNLNSGDVPPTNTFSATDATSYNESTSVAAYDSLGNANRVNLYFVNATTTGGTPTWNVYADPVTSTGTDVGTTPPALLTTLTFDSSGVLAPASDNATLSVNWNNSSANSNINFDFAGTTLGAQQFAVAGTTNDGYAPGSYNGVSIASNGQVTATYSNGQTVNAGTLSIANFINQAGLQPVSGNLYATTDTSGQPVIDAPGVGQAGEIKGGYLEQSNASTSSLLVSLIQFQQAYQANTSVIQTEQQDSQRLVQI